MFMRTKKTACLQAADWVIEAARNEPSESIIHMEIISSPKKFLICLVPYVSDVLS